MLEHILRRLGFGASPADMAVWSEMDPSAVIDRLLNYESQPTDIDTRIGDAAYVLVTTQGRPFSPDTAINPDSLSNDMYSRPVIKACRMCIIQTCTLPYSAVRPILF